MIFSIFYFIINIETTFERLTTFREVLGLI
nr:MAG TPA: hypothetical protein [Bacteriophage sp.]